MSLHVDGVEVRLEKIHPGMHRTPQVVVTRCDEMLVNIMGTDVRCHIRMPHAHKVVASLRCGLGPLNLIEKFPCKDRG